MSLAILENDTWMNKAANHIRFLCIEAAEDGEIPDVVDIEEAIFAAASEVVADVKAK